MEVKLLRREGHSALVQWFDGAGVQRGIVPVSVLKGDYIDTEELDRAIPWGEPWEELVELKATSQDLARNLRKVGIWTLDDLRKHPNEAQGAIMQTYGVDYQQLLKLTYKARKG